MWVCLYVMIRDNLHKFPYTILSELDGWIKINLCMLIVHPLVSLSMFFTPC